MNLILSFLLGLAGCMVLSHSMGHPIVIVFQDDDERRNMVWFVVIATAMLGVLAVCAGAPRG